MSNIECVCCYCQGTGVSSNVTGLDADHTCRHCGGDGIVTGDNIPALNDILDKVNDVLDKCDDILEQVTEP